MPFIGLRFVGGEDGGRAGVCDKPTGLKLDPLSSDLIKVDWNTNPMHLSYRVSYRKYNPTQPFKWMEQTATTNATNLTQLEPDTEYEVMVGGFCAVNFLNNSDPIRAKTLPKDQIKGVVCGNYIAPNLTNKTPISTLIVGDIITAGDFPVKLTKVVGGNGSFTGEGIVSSPWLAFVPFKVKFSNISVNTDKKLIGGFIETAYDPNGSGILYVDGIFEGGTKVGIVRTGKDTTEFSVNFPVTGTGNISVQTNTLGGASITITGANGQTQTISATSLPTSIRDSSGQIYGVTEKGTVILIGKAVNLPMSETELNSLNDDKGTVQFVEYASGFYAFDAYKADYESDGLWKQKYEKIGTYGVGRKAEAPGKPDVVKVIVTLGTGLIPDSVRFITAKGTQYTSKSLGSSAYEVNIVGGLGGDAQELYALYPKNDGSGKFWSLGKLLIASYTPQKRKMVLVPVNGAVVNKYEITSKINQIYNPVCVTWEVEVAPNFADASWDLNNNGLDVRGSGAFSTLTTEMKNLNKAYKKGRSLYADALYMFVLDKSSDSTVIGDMPRGKQFGYLFTQNNNVKGETVAHEVGHGLFKLKHTFDGYNFPKDLLTDNLMNYGQGVKLSKYQWDQIHDPGLVLGLFDTDDDSYLTNVQLREIPLPTISDENPAECSGTTKYLGLAPNGFPISKAPDNCDSWLISDETSNLYFITGFRINVNNTIKEYLATYTEGVFQNYTLNGIAGGVPLTDVVYFTDAGKTSTVSVRKCVNACYFIKTDICWVNPSSVLKASAIIAQIITTAETDGKIWLSSRLKNGLCGSEKFKNDFGVSNGLYYSLGGSNLNNTEAANMVDKINLLVEELMDATDYDQYIKKVMTDSKKTFLTYAELEDLYKSLETIKYARSLISPTAIFKDVIQWIRDCNASSNPQGCSVSDNLIPRCLWDNGFASSTAGKLLGLPSYSGIIDGAYQTIKGVVSLAALAGKFSYGTARFFNCWINPLEYSSYGIDPNCQGTRDGTKEVLGYVEKFVKDPATRSATYDIAKNFKSALSAEFDTWWNQTLCIGNTPEQERCCQYNQGRLIFDIASCFIGVGEFKAAAEGGSFFAKITSQLTKVSDVLSKIKTSAWLKLKPVLAPVQRIMKGVLIVIQLSTVSVEAGQLTGKAAQLIEHILPGAQRVVVEQSFQLGEKMALGTALETAEVAALKTSATAAIAENVSNLTVIEGIGLEYKGVEKAAGNIGFVKAGVDKVIIISQNQANLDFQVLAQITGVGVGGTLNFVKSAPNPNNTCTFCRNNNVVLCSKLEALNRMAVEGAAANNIALTTVGGVVKAVGINKLCNELALSDVALLAIIDRINGFALTNDRLLFIKDLEGSTPTQHIGANISSLNVDIVDAWKFASDMPTRNSINYLNNIIKAQNSSLPVHLIGEINEQNKAVGCHLLSAVDGNRVKFIYPNLIEYRNSDIFRAKIQINGIEKKSFSSFYPRTWDVNKTLKEVAFVLENTVSKIDNYNFKGLASDGVTTIKVEFTGPLNNLKYSTAYPE